MPKTDELMDGDPEHMVKKLLVGLIVAGALVAVAPATAVVAVAAAPVSVSAEANPVEEKSDPAGTALPIVGLWAGVGVLGLAGGMVAIATISRKQKPAASRVAAAIS